MKGGYHVWLSAFPCEMMVLCATDIFEAILYNKAALCLISNKKNRKKKKKTLRTTEKDNEINFSFIPRLWAQMHKFFFSIQPC